jgi:hypothetical protein
MFCNYCRAVNPDDAVYCNSCGRTIQKHNEGNSGLQRSRVPNIELPSGKLPSIEVRNNIDSQLSKVSTAASNVELGASPIPGSEPSISMPDAVSNTGHTSAAISASKPTEIKRSVTCPRCKLTNPGTAQRCDCGYDFETKTVEKPYFTTIKENRLLSLKALGMLGIFLTAAIVTTWLASALFNLPNKAIEVLTHMSLSLAFGTFLLVRGFGGAWLTVRKTTVLAAGFSICLLGWVTYMVATAAK